MPLEAVQYIRRCRLLFALLLPLAVILLGHASGRPARPGGPAADLAAASGHLATFADDLRHVDATPGPQAQTPDNMLQVPWNGTIWQSMPNFTWAACDVSASTRKVIDVAIGQWSYASSNQGIPIRLAEVPCASGSTQAQIRIGEASSREVSSLTGAPDLDVFGMTIARDASNHICGIDVSGQCIAVVARIYLFVDNWASNGLNTGQRAKTTAHEIGHAVGLGHAHFCNFDSIMAQNCEPILQGLGPDDVQSLDALVDHVRTYFSQSPANAQPSAPPPGSGGVSVTYHAGYNLVAGPRGTSFSGSSGSLYTLVSGDSSYRTVAASQTIYDGYGYWAYFPQDVTVQLNGSGGSFFSTLATPGQWFMVGNENGSSPMRVLGADTVYTYDPQGGGYQPATTLQPGQAAWVKPDKGGMVALASTSLSRDQTRCYLNLGSPASC